MSGRFNEAICGGRCHNLKNGKEASEDTEESPAGCAGEDKQSKGNIGEEERTIDSVKFEFYDDITRRRREGKGEGVWGVG